MSIYEIGILVIMVAVLTLILYFSKYYESDKLLHMFQHGQLTAMTIFVILAIPNYIVVFSILTRLNNIYLTHTTNHIDRGILVLTAILSLLLVSLLIFIEMDNIILKNKRYPYTLFFEHTRKILALIVIVLSFAILFMTMKN